MYPYYSPNYILIMHVFTDITCRAIVLAAFAFGSVGLTRFVGYNEGGVAKYTQLASEGETLMDLLDSMYTETNVGSASICTLIMNIRLMESTIK